MAAAVATKEIVVLPQDFRRGIVLPTPPTTDGLVIVMHIMVRAHYYFLAGFDN
jgi:hypothetical protein